MRKVPRGLALGIYICKGPITVDAKAAAGDQTRMQKK